MDAEYRDAMGRIIARGDTALPPLSPDVQRQADREAADRARRQRDAAAWEAENRRMQNDIYDRVTAEAIAANEAAEREAIERRATERRQREEAATSPEAEELAAMRAANAGAYRRF